MKKIFSGFFAFAIAIGAVTFSVNLSPKTAHASDFCLSGWHQVGPTMSTGGEFPLITANYTCAEQPGIILHCRSYGNDDAQFCEESDV